MTNSEQIINLNTHTGYPMGLQYKTIDLNSMQIEYLDTKKPEIGARLFHWYPPLNFIGSVLRVSEIMACEERSNNRFWLKVKVSKSVSQ